jgi:hypothetical protein
VLVGLDFLLYSLVWYGSASVWFRLVCFDFICFASFDTSWFGMAFVLVRFDSVHFFGSVSYVLSFAKFKNLLIQLNNTVVTNPTNSSSWMPKSWTDVFHPSYDRVVQRFLTWLPAETTLHTIQISCQSYCSEYNNLQDFKNLKILCDFELNHNTSNLNAVEYCAAKHKVSRNVTCTNQAPIKAGGVIQAPRILHSLKIEFKF